MVKIWLFFVRICLFLLLALHFFSGPGTKCTFIKVVIGGYLNRSGDAPAKFRQKGYFHAQGKDKIMIHCARNFSIVQVGCALFFVGHFSLRRDGWFNQATLTFMKLPIMITGCPLCPKKDTFFSNVEMTLCDAKINCRWTDEKTGKFYKKLINCLISA